MVEELKEKIAEFLTEQSYITVPMAQEKFGADYASAREAIRRLVNAKQLEYSGGLLYSVPIPTEEEVLEKERARAAAERLALIEKRRKEFQEEQARRGEGAPKEDLAAEIKAERERRMVQFNFFDQLVKGFRPVQDGEEYIINTDISYPDDRKIVIKAIVGEPCRFNDCGRTMEYLRAFFNLEDERVSRRMEDILSGYNVKEIDGVLEIEVPELYDASSVFLFLYAAIERLININAGDLFDCVSADIEKQATQALKEIVLNYGETYASAKAKADELLGEANGSGDKERALVYAQVARAFNEITEINYELAKRNILSEG